MASAWREWSSAASAVGFAISKVDEEEAARSYRYLEEMDQLAELSASELERDLEVPG